jgi:hypothetical protein
VDNIWKTATKAEHAALYHFARAIADGLAHNACLGFIWLQQFSMIFNGLTAIANTASRELA